MKKYKVTLYNPTKNTVRRFTYIFEWDGVNHCWISNGNIFRMNPADMVQRMAEAIQCDGEYITIK